MVFPTPKCKHFGFGNSILNSKVDSELIVREFTNEILNIAHLSIDSIRRLENDVLARCFKKRMQSNSYEEYKIGDTIFDVIARSKDTQKYEKLSLLIDRADKLFSQGGKEALINLSEGIHFLDRVKINVLLELQLRANFKVALSRNDCKFENGQLISVAPHLPKMRIIPSSKLSETKERRNVSVRQILPAPVAEKNNQPSFPITPPVRLIRVLPRQEIPVGTITTTISTQLPVFENRNAVQPCANQTYPLIPTPIRYQIGRAHV